PDLSGGPRVIVLRGGNFAQVASFYGIDDQAFRGGARAAVADLNADGFGDVVVSAGYGGGPRVAGFSGRFLTDSTGSPTNTPYVRLFDDFFMFETSVRNGVFITAGDINGDGYADVIAGGGPDGGPRVRVVSGRAITSGNQTVVLANFFAAPDDQRGGVRVAAKDLNGDRYADLVTGAGAGYGTRITLFGGSASTTGGPMIQLSSFDAFPGNPNGVFVG
ncbi:MAG TPA: hypothetical protein VM597_11720, partial [Gemmataceae bacterium]|nr:hypothetical protein [Gemmataceae bacterium]